MKILDEITEAWEKAKADVVRPMECPFDYFGEGYLAAHLSQNVEIQRLRAIIAATEWAKRLFAEGPRGVFVLCRIFGWSNVKEALTYFDESADDIAGKL